MTAAYALVLGLTYGSQSSQVTVLNGQFEMSDELGRPLGWFVPAPQREAGFEVAVAQSGMPEHGACLVMSSSSTYEGPGVTLQALPMEGRWGQEFTLTAWIKLDPSASPTATMWAWFDDGRHRSLPEFKDGVRAGGVGWKKYTLKGRVPIGARNLCFGFELAGKGKFCADDVTLGFEPPLQ